MIRIVDIRSVSALHRWRLPHSLTLRVSNSGDVGGGHYYVVTRPAGRPYWIKFDDERVAPVSPNAALEDCFGGRDCSCTDFTKIEAVGTGRCPTAPGTTATVAATATGVGAVLRMHSAYILFYVKKSEMEQLLIAPDPITVRRPLIICAFCIEPVSP